MRPDLGVRNLEVDRISGTLSKFEQSQDDNTTLDLRRPSERTNVRLGEGVNRNNQSKITDRVPCPGIATE